MAHYSEILGEVVDDIRLRRAPARNVANRRVFGHTRSAPSQIAEYLDQAFCLYQAIDPACSSCLRKLTGCQMLTSWTGDRSRGG